MYESDKKNLIQSIIIQNESTICNISEQSHKLDYQVIVVSITMHLIAKNIKIKQRNITLLFMLIQSYSSFNVVVIILIV